MMSKYPFTFKTLELWCIESMFVMEQTTKGESWMTLNWAYYTSKHSHQNFTFGNVLDLFSGKDFHNL